jgi:calcium permeable stress-gated cation channel
LKAHIKAQNKSRVRSKDALLDLVPLDKWPTYREGKIPFVGRKLNTFENCKMEIQKFNVDIPRQQQKCGEGRPLGAVFIECNLQIGAHVLSQVVAYHEVISLLFICAVLLLTIYSATEDVGPCR